MTHAPVKWQTLGQFFQSAVWNLIWPFIKIFSTLFSGTECLGGQWTRWFNTDHPLEPTGELRKGDLETLDRAQLESRRVCQRPLGFKIAIDDLTNGPGLPVMDVKI